MMDGEASTVCMGAAFFLLGLAIGFGYGCESHDRVYKRGQIDALTGKTKYHLVEHEDGTKTWERKDGDQ